MVRGVTACASGEGRQRALWVSSSPAETVKRIAELAVESSGTRNETRGINDFAESDVSKLKRERVTGQSWQAPKQVARTRL